MKIIFDKAVLTEALAPAMGSVSNKNTMNSTEGILIETDGKESCVLSAYDLEKGMRLTIPAQVIEGGSYIIKADKLNQIVRAMPENIITLEVDKRNVTKISSGRSSYELHAMKGEDFPNLPELTVEGGIQIKQSELRAMITGTIFAVAQNDVRAALNGEFFKIEGSKITLVSCDSSKLAVMSRICEIPDADNVQYKFILPGRSLTELGKLTSDTDELIAIRPGRKHVIFKIGEIFFFSRLIDEEYIDYDRFIPKNNRIFATLNVADFSRSLERALLVTEDKAVGQSKPPIRCSFRGDYLQLSSVSLSGSFSDELAVKKEGEDIDIGFNCRYLLDAVKSCNVDEIKLSMSTPLMSMIIEPVDEEDYSFVFLVLPCKLKD